MELSLKPILADLSKKLVVGNLAQLVEACANCECVKYLLTPAGASVAAFAAPALAMLGMEMFKDAKDRNDQQAFEQHCKEVADLLRKIDHKTEHQLDEATSRLDDILSHRQWVWARISAADQDALAKRIREKLPEYSSQINEYITKFQQDTTDRLEGLVIYAAETIRTLDNVKFKYDALSNQIKELKQLLLNMHLYGSKPASIPLHNFTDDSPLDRALHRVADAAKVGVESARQAIENKSPGKAAEYYIDRLERLKQTDQSEVDFCRDAAEVLYRTGNIGNAENALNRILRILPNDLDAINRLGWIYKLQGKLASAEKQYRDLLKLADSDARWQANALTALGLIESDQGKYDDANEYQTRAYKLALTKRDHVLIGRTLSRLGYNFIQTGQTSKGTRFIRRSFRHFKLANDESGQASICTYLGLILLEKDPKQASEYFEESKKLHQNLKDLNGIAIDIANIGLAAMNNHKYDISELNLLDAVDRFKSLGYLYPQARQLLNLASLAVLQGNTPLAVDRWKSARDIVLKLPDNSGVKSFTRLIEDKLLECAREWVDQATTDFKRGHFLQAGDYFTKSKLIYEKLGVTSQHAEILGCLGFVALKLGHIKETRKFWLESLKLFTEDNNVQRAKQVTEWLAGIPSK